MKQYLYYDENRINSIIAQLEKGLPIKEENSTEGHRTDSQENSFIKSLSSELNAKVLGVGGYLNGNLADDISKTTTLSDIAKNLSETVYHDFALDKALEDLKNKNLLNKSIWSVGDFVEYKSPLTLFDTSYLDDLIKEPSIFSLMNKQIDIEIKEIDNQLNQKGFPKEGRKELIDKKDSLKKAKSENNHNKNSINLLLEILEKLLPFERFIILENFIIPLEEDYLRDKSKCQTIKYGGEVTAFGYITNIIKVNDSFKNTTPIEEINNALLTILQSLVVDLFSIKQKVIYILNPIAIYYETSEDLK